MRPPSLLITTWSNAESIGGKSQEEAIVPLVIRDLFEPNGLADTVELDTKWLALFHICVAVWVRETLAPAQSALADSPSSIPCHILPTPPCP